MGQYFRQVYDESVLKYQEIFEQEEDKAQLPKISVIVPVYNVEKYLQQCLESLLNQTLSNIEIICVNDGSTDNSSEILNEYAEKDNRIKVINKTNEGLSSARNEGLKYATSEYIYFLDSDDFVEKSLMETAYNVLKENDIDYYCFGSKAFSETNTIIQNLDDINEYLRIKFDGIKNLNFTIGMNQNINVWNKIFKKSIIKKHSLHFINKLLYEDIYFTWLYFFLSKKAYFDKRIFHNYRIQESSIMEKCTRNKTYETAVPHIFNWLELFKSIKSDKALFRENYNNLSTLLSIYYKRTLELAPKSDNKKIKKLYRSHLKELDKAIISNIGILKFILYKQKIFKIEKHNNRMQILGIKIRINKK